MASNAQDTNAQWRTLEDGETVQLNRGDNMQRLRKFAKVTFVLAGVFAVAFMVTLYYGPQQQVEQADGELAVNQPSTLPANTIKEIEKAATPAQIREVKTIAGFNELLSSSIVTDAKELYDAMSNNQFEELHNDFLETIGTSVPVSGNVPESKQAYPSQSEHAKRLEVFKNTILTVLTQCANEYKYSQETSRARYGITVHADWTEDEFTNTRLNKAFSHSDLEEEMKGLNQDPEPSQLYAKCNMVYTGPVRDQGRCGSCWAYSAVQQLRYMAFAKTKRDPGMMSAEYLIDCDPDVHGHRCNGGVNGCCGGLPFRADMWLSRTGGLPTKADYGPSLSQTDPMHSHTCHRNARKTVRPVGGPFQYKTEDAIATTLCAKGPVSIAIAANNNLMHYNGGIMDVHRCPANRINHAVLYVGYDPSFDSGEPVHVVLNSWSDAWGVSGRRPYKHGNSNGYVLFKYGQNVCNMKYLATGPNTVELV